MKADLAKAIHDYGEPVEYTPQGGATLYLTASVQGPVMDPLVNDLDMAGFIVYFASGDLTAAPKKFDKIKIRGKIRTVDEDAVEEKLSGNSLVYIARTRG